MGTYTDKKINNTPKAKKLKNKLEELGHQNVEVWWENISRGSEMSGYEGGWFFCSQIIEKDTEDTYFEPLGYNFEEAMEYIENYCDIREIEEE